MYECFFFCLHLFKSAFLCDTDKRLHCVYIFVQIPIVRDENSCSPGVRIFYVPLFLVTKATHVRFGWICAVPRISADKTKKRNKRKWERTHWDRANYKYFYFIIIGIRCHVPHAEQIICFHLAHFLQCFAGWLVSTRFKSLWDCKTAAMLLCNNKKKREKYIPCWIASIKWHRLAKPCCFCMYVVKRNTNPCGQSDIQIFSLAVWHSLSGSVSNPKKAPNKAALFNSLLVQCAMKKTHSESKEQSLGCNVIDFTRVLCHMTLCTKVWIGFIFNQLISFSW